MDLEKIDRSSSIIKYSKTDNVLTDICSIIESARDYAFQSVNLALVERNWLIGYRIAETRAKIKLYKFIHNLCEKLMKQYYDVMYVDDVK